jgi:anti-anti-sigma factor
MPNYPATPQGDELPLGTVEVAHPQHGLAVVSMRGEHDLSTAPELTRALAEAAAHSNVVVDLSECTFIDSTVLNALAKTARAVHAQGERLVLVIPSETSQVARIAQMTHLAEILSIHSTHRAALASIQSEAQP